MSDPSRAGHPVLRVVRGEPSPEELSALVVVLGACRAADLVPAAPRGRSAWSDPARLVRRGAVIGPGGWRRSALPG